MQLWRPVTLLKGGTDIGIFLRMLRFFKNSSFYRTPLVAAFMSTQKGRRWKCGTKEWGKVFQMKQENETMSFNFYLQVLVLVITEIQIQLHKYENCSHFFSYFFFKFCFFWFLRVHLRVFCVFRVTVISIFRSSHCELFCKTAAAQDITKIVKFTLQNWSYSFQYNLRKEKFKK